MVLIVLDNVKTGFTVIIEYIEIYFSINTIYPNLATSFQSRLIPNVELRRRHHQRISLKTKMNNFSILKTLLTVNIPDSIELVIRFRKRIPSNHCLFIFVNKLLLIIDATVPAQIPRVKIYEYFKEFIFHGNLIMFIFNGN